MSTGMHIVVKWHKLFQESISWLVARLKITNYSLQCFIITSFMSTKLNLKQLYCINIFYVQECNLFVSPANFPWFQLENHQNNPKKHSRIHPRFKDYKLTRRLYQISKKIHPRCNNLREEAYTTWIFSHVAILIIGY